MTTLRNLFYLVLGAVLAIFIYFNFDQRVVIYLTRTWRTQEIPLSLALFGALLAGFLVAGILSIADQFRLRSRLRRMRRTIEQLESEITELSRPPIEPSLSKGPEPEDDTDSSPVL